MRSMGTVNFTKVNFSLLELFRIIRRVEIQNEILHFKLSDSDIRLPRITHQSHENIAHNMPSLDEIFKTLERAKVEAMKDALNFGIKVGPNQIVFCGLKFQKESRTIYQPDPISDDEVDGGDQTIEQDLYFNLRDYSEEEMHLKNNSNHFKCQNKDGEAILVRKSSVLWALTTDKYTLSCDRLRRVQMSELETNSQRLIRVQNRLSSESALMQSKEIQIGHWCAFLNLKRDSVSKYFLKNDDQIAKHIVVGMVTGFKYIKGKSKKEQQYSWDYASVSVPAHIKHPRGIAVLATWYQLNDDGILSSQSAQASFYLNMNEYLSNIPKEIVGRKKLLVDASHIRSLLVNICKSKLVVMCHPENK